jgi:chromosomal replication initiator protein
MQANQVWQAVLSELRGTLPPRDFESMLKTSTIVAFDADQAVVAMPNAYAAEWSETRLTGQVERLMSNIIGAPITVRFGVREGTGYYMPPTGGQRGAPNGSNGSNGMSHNDSAQPGVYPREPRNGSGSRPTGDAYMEDSSPLNPRYIFEHFIVGSGNRLAHAASLAVADNPGQAYNPLFIYGGVGLGKTHLLHAIGHQAMQRFGNLRVLYVSSEKFTNDMINAIREGTNETFRNRYRRIDILLIDDIQFIAGKESTQEEFFHTFNALHESMKQIVIASDRPPKELAEVEDRLRSRFEWGLIADIQPPDLETKVAILQKKSEQEKVILPVDVALYIASNIRSNVRELEGALIRLVAHSSLIGAEITLPYTQQVLKNFIDSQARKVTIESIQKAVAEQFGLRLVEIKAKNNSRAIVYPRQIAMYLAKHLTESSLPEIGRQFGGKHHTTVLHSVEKIDEARKTDKDLNRLLTKLTEQLGG